MQGPPFLFLDLLLLNPATLPCHGPAGQVFMYALLRARCFAASMAKSEENQIMNVNLKIGVRLNAGDLF